MLVVDRGKAKEEKIECSSLTSGTVVVANRGYDGTSPQSHDTGATVEHFGPSAAKMDDLDGHVYDTTRDDHAQYIPIDGSRGFTGVNQIAGTPLSIGGLSNLSGSALTFARSDHVHAIATAGISDSGMFAAQVVNAAAIADSSLTAAKFATTLGAPYIVADAAALAALSPKDGDLAYVQDIDQFYGRSIGVWRALGPADKADFTTNLSWTPRTTTGDLTNWTVTSRTQHTLQRPHISLWVSPGADVAAWSASIDVYTDVAKAGTWLGGTQFVNESKNRHLEIFCDEFDVAAGAAQTYYLNVTYAVATPTAGFDTASTFSQVRNNRQRTQIRVTS